MAWHDKETGLVEPKFIKLYVEDLSRLKNLSKTERNVLDKLMVITTNIGYNNEIRLSKKDRINICEYAETSDKNLTNVLVKLIKHDIIRRVAVGCYVINPDFAYRGKQGNRAKLIIQYNELGERESMKLEVE